MLQPFMIICFTNTQQGIYDAYNKDILKYSISPITIKFQFDFTDFRLNSIKMKLHHTSHYIYTAIQQQLKCMLYLDII